jgi:hypothetical protein
MKTLMAMVAGLTLTASIAPAQVSVEVLLDQERFLRGEDIPVRVRITNVSGQTLELGDTPEWLTFDVEGERGLVAAKLREVPVEGRFSLASAKAGIKRVSLTPHFELNRFGRYTVTATLRVRQWGREWQSSPQKFDLVQGRKLWEVDFGVPTVAGAPGPAPELRKYALLQGNHLKELKLYFQLTDPAEAAVFTVFPIGPIVSFSKPEAQVDQEAHLHVLYQVGARSFSYTVINPDGNVTLRRTYDYTGEIRPRLRPGPEGKIAVAGGTLRPSREDAPPPQNTPAPTDAPPAQP